MGLPTYKEIKEEMYSGKSQPVTTEDHMKYFYGALVRLVNKNDGKRKVLVNSEWVEPTDEFNKIVDGIHENLIRNKVRNKQATDADKSNPVRE